MIWFAIGALALVAGLWAVGKLTRGDPRKIAEFVRNHGKQAAGVALLAISGFMAIRGNWVALMVLGPIGLGLLKVGPWAGGPWAQNTTPSTGQRSTVRSAFFEMVLDHDSGTLTGRVLAGTRAGQSLDDLDEDALRLLAREAAGDPDSLALLEAYLDRRFPGRREHVDEDAGARQRGARPTQAMTDEEAHQILGLQPGAGPDEVRTAHRALMKRLHPDQGGSNWLAAKVNEAKDVLLRRHGRMD
jgi:hypothetical protein